MPSLQLHTHIGPTNHAQGTFNTSRVPGRSQKKKKFPTTLPHCFTSRKKKRLPKKTKHSFPTFCNLTLHQTTQEKCPYQSPASLCQNKWLPSSYRNLPQLLPQLSNKIPGHKKKNISYSNFDELVQDDNNLLAVHKRPTDSPQKPSIVPEAQAHSTFNKSTHPELPEGWSEEFSKSRQRIYYYNSITQKSTWKHPGTRTPTPRPQDLDNQDEKPSPDHVGTSDNPTPDPPALFSANS